VSGTGAGFDALTGAGTGSPEGPGPQAPPDGIRTMGNLTPSATRLVLVRHGEAVCNVSGVCGGPVGCTGLTDRGRAQVAVLAARLTETGELAGADALYSSVLPRAVETARILAPALRAPGVSGSAEPVQECGFCELHPGEADGLDWGEFSARYGNPDWDVDPDRVIAPGGESWTGFVNRVSDTLDTVTARHAGQLVVVACHAGVVEASLLAKLPVVGGRTGARMKLRTEHASLTTWEVDDGSWKLIGYNDGAHHLGTEGVGGGTEPTTESGRSWMSVGTGTTDSGASGERTR
jgi:probable phosphoglycerate mutase